MDMLTLALPDNRSEDHNPGALRQGHYLIDHLTDGLCLELDAVFWAVGSPTRIKSRRRSS